MSRTAPTLLDVGIAIFGGVAGIVAGSRKEQTNAIPGVAIATALMPPLCVTGYGLANGRLDIFFGAFYLFFLNAVFIALSTYVIVRFLRFPYMEFINSSDRKKVSRWIFVFVVFLIAPATWLLVSVISEQRTQLKVEEFTEQELRNHRYIVTSSDLHFHEKSKEPDTLHLEVFGSDSLDVDALEQKLTQYDLDNCVLEVEQIIVSNKYIQKMMVQKEDELSEFATRQKAIIAQKNKSIEQLKSRIDSLEKAYTDFSDLEKEFKTFYPRLESASLSHKNDSLQICILKWKAKLSTRTRKLYQSRIQQVLSKRLEPDSVEVVSIF